MKNNEIHIKLDESALEEIRRKILYPYNNIGKIVLFAVELSAIINIFITLLLIILFIIS